MSVGVGKKRIAIVGSGVSGLGALYALKDARHEVHLYEAQDRLGGHTNTVDFVHNGQKTAVDTGFIVMNTATYPNFIPFLKELGVETCLTDMTFGVSRDGGVFEWSGTSPASVFAQRSNIFRPSFWGMIFDIIRFNQFALDLLNTETSVDFSIGDYLDREGYSEAFKNDYLLPMTACVWSTGPDKCALDFPAVTLIRFLWNHHLLNTVAARPPWMTIVGGSKQYIQAVLKACPLATIHLSTPVKYMRNDPSGKVILSFDSSKDETFDAVILACHGPQAASIVSTSATAQERRILGSFETTRNVAYLHSDTSLMPRRHVTWSSWNYLTSTAPTPTASQPTTNGVNGHEKGRQSDVAAAGRTKRDATVEKVSLTYNMNVLQHLPGPRPPPPHHTHPVSADAAHILVTLNPPHEPAPSLTQAVIPYEHPLYTAAAVAAQKQLPAIQGTRGVYYAGAWTGYGFHEDGFRSGIEVACRPELGGKVGWEVVDAREMRGHLPTFGWRDRAVRVVLVVLMVLFGWAGHLLGVALGVIGWLPVVGQWHAGGEDEGIVRIRVKDKAG